MPSSDQKKARPSRLEFESASAYCNVSLGESESQTSDTSSWSFLDRRPMPNDSLSDNQLADQLLQRYWAGDEGAFRELHERFALPLQSYLRRFGSDPKIDLDAVLQETWLKVAEIPSSFQGGNFFGWAKTVAYRKLIDAVRKQRKSPDAISDDRLLADYSQDESSRHSDSDQLDALKKCLQSLEGKFVDVLRDLLCGMSRESISEKYSLEIGAVNVRVHRGRRQLGDCIKRRIGE